MTGSTPLQTMTPPLTSLISGYRCLEAITVAWRQYGQHPWIVASLGVGSRCGCYCVLACRPVTSTNPRVRDDPTDPSFPRAIAHCWAWHRGELSVGQRVAARRAQRRDRRACGRWRQANRYGVGLWQRRKRNRRYRSREQRPEQDIHSNENRGSVCEGGRG